MPARDQFSSVKPSPGQPLYSAVRDAIRDVVETGSYSPGERLPSTKEISERMGVSLVTVHRALQELVSAGVVRRGQGKGTFVHEEYARRPATHPGLRLGLVFHAQSSLADSYHGRVLEGVRQVAHDNGIDLVILRFGEDWRNECHGYIYVNPFEEQLDRPPRFSHDAAAPIVLVGASYKRPGIACIDIDNVDIARQAVSHLAALGHRRIGFVGDSSNISNSRDRWNGFLHACEDLGVESDTSVQVRCDGWKLDEPASRALLKMLSVPDPPSAIFAAGYYFALDVYAAARRVGLRIPADLSVVGVDDPPSAAHLSPALTTVRQPLDELGRAAAELLLDAKDGAAPGSRRSLTAELVIRESSGVAARADKQKDRPIRTGVAQ